MGRRKKSHLCGPQDSSVQVSKWGALIGLFSLLLLYYCFRKDGFLRHHHRTDGLTEIELTNLRRTEKENKFSGITRSIKDIRIINVVPIGHSNKKGSGFLELSRRSTDHAVKEYEAMPNATKELSIFLFHSFNMMSDSDMDGASYFNTFDVASHLESASRISHSHIYNEIPSTQEMDLLSSALKVRQFIEAVVHVRLSLESSASSRSSGRAKPYSKLRSAPQGSKLQLNFFVADVHTALYHSVVTWVLGLSPSLENCVVHSVETVTSEHVQWESEHSFQHRVVDRADRALKELGHWQRLVESADDLSTLSVLGRSRLKYL